MQEVARAAIAPSTSQGLRERLRAAIGPVRTEDAELLDRLKPLNAGALDYLSVDDLVEIAHGGSSAPSRYATEAF